MVLGSKGNLNNQTWVVATHIFFEFSSRNLGKIFTHFDEHIIQMGWFNHQPETVGSEIIRTYLVGSEKNPPNGLLKLLVVVSFYFNVLIYK